MSGGVGKAAGFGSPHRHLAATDSTNTRARELAEAGAPGGTVVTAGEQSAGRGRQGRSWVAPPGRALLYSAILRPLDERHLLLPLAVPIAVCEAAEELAPGTECAIKWPNDVWVGERKLAGILVEGRPQEGWAVIGVGLNLTIAQDEFPQELRETAASLFSPRDAAIPISNAGIDSRGKGRGRHPAAASPAPPPTPLTAAQVLSECLDRWVAKDEDEILAEWRDRDALRGRAISWAEGSGVADGVDDTGRLVVVVPGGDRVALGAGEVHLSL